MSRYAVSLKVLFSPISSMGIPRYLRIPLSPSRKVMALMVEAVFMKAGSSVTRPVFARRLEMSTPFSSSVPSTTSRSRSCLPVDMRTISDTASLLWQVACARTLPQPPGHGADANARRPGGGQIDDAVADQQHLRRRELQGSAEGQQAFRRRLSRAFVAADHRAEGPLDFQPAQDLARESPWLVGEDRARVRRSPQQVGDPGIQAGPGQQALPVLLAPERGRFGITLLLVGGAERAADQAFRSFADESANDHGVALRKAQPAQHRVDAVRQVVA